MTIFSFILYIGLVAKPWGLNVLSFFIWFFLKLFVFYEHFSVFSSQEQLQKLYYYLSEMSSDSRESLDHRDPPLFSESRYQSRYQDRDLKSLDSSLDIKTQDCRVSIPVSITRFKLQKSRFQSQYLDLTLEFPTFV